jgi:hypothetical protein
MWRIPLASNWPNQSASKAESSLQAQKHNPPWAV